MDVFLWNRHLVVTSSATEHVALCLHPLDCAEAPFSHSLLEAKHLPIFRLASFDPGSWLSISEAKQLAVDLALGVTEGNKTQAARLLGVSVRSVRNWMR